MFLLLKGVSAIATEGDSSHDPDTDGALFDAIRSGLDRGPVELSELDMNVHDPAFVAAMVATLLDFVACIADQPLRPGHASSMPGRRHWSTCTESAMRSVAPWSRHSRVFTAFLLGAIVIVLTDVEHLQQIGTDPIAAIGGALAGVIDGYPALVSGAIGDPGRIVAAIQSAEFVIGGLWGLSRQIDRVRSGAATNTMARATMTVSSASSGTPRPAPGR